jgi:hypothetical protein
VNIRANLKYLRTVLRHKWYVLRFGWGTVPLWRLITHDLSKFSRAEWSAYVTRFASGRAGKEDKHADTQAFVYAWRHHYLNNPHHWEFWMVENFMIPSEGAKLPRARWKISDSFDKVDGMATINIDYRLQVYQMPETFVREMIADWKAASKAYSGSDNVIPWYESVAHKQVMHPRTRARVEELLGYGGMGQ